MQNSLSEMCTWAEGERQGQGKLNSQLIHIYIYKIGTDTFDMIDLLATD